MKQENKSLAIGPLLVSERVLERIGLIAMGGCVLSMVIWPTWFAGGGLGSMSLWVLAAGLSMRCASTGAFRRWVDVSVKERRMAFAGVMFALLGTIGGLVSLVQGQSAK